MTRKLAKNAGDSVALKTDFYHDQLSKYWAIAILLIILLLITLISIFYLYKNKPSPKYFVVNNNTVLTEMPLDKPIYSDPYIRDWASRAAMEIFNFDFLNYNINLANIKNSFTDPGYKRFINWFENNILTDILKNYYIVNLHLCNIPKILSQAVIPVNNIPTYQWLVQLPIVITYQSSEKKVKVASLLQIVLQRVSNINYLSPIKIDEIKFTNLKLVNTNAFINYCM